MTNETQPIPARLAALQNWASRVGPGFLVCGTVAIAAKFLSERYGAPAMLMALLLGIAFHFLSEAGACVAGVEFTAKQVLRSGVALLGVRISVSLLIGLGWETIALLVLAIAATILFALLAARMLGRGWRMALLTGGSVAICGVSAAIAIAAVLPKNQFSERNLIFTVICVTVLSTIAMIFYPTLIQAMGLDHRAAGIFLGGTIHDVAQVVGAGFSVSEETGRVATLVKLIRVTMLAPVVLVFSLVFRKINAAEGTNARPPPLLPGFVGGFLVLAALNSFGYVPPQAVSLANDVSGWALLLGIAAAGIRTTMKSIFDVGKAAIALIVLGGIKLIG